MELRHYTDEPFTLDRSWTKEQSAEYKPRGLWFSILGEYDWPTWCEEEGFRTDRLVVEYDVKLTPEANILHLSTPKQLLTFTEEYSVPFGSSGLVLIDWPRLATLYDGIIISPYQWSVRFELHWYYGWDVASGCIWNLDAIQKLEPVTPVLDSVDTQGLS